MVSDPIFAHPDVGVNSQPVLRRSMHDGITKKLKIFVASEDHLPIIAALDDVLRLAGENVSRQTRNMNLDWV